MWLLIPEQLWTQNICTDSLAVILPKLVQLLWIGSTVLEEKCTGTSCPLVNPFVKNMVVSKKVQVLHEHFWPWKNTFWIKIFPFKMNYLSLQHSQGIHVFWTELIQHKTVQALLTPYNLHFFTSILLGFVPWKTYMADNHLHWCNRARERSHRPQFYISAFLPFQLIINFYYQNNASRPQLRVKLLWTWCYADIQKKILS